MFRMAPNGPPTPPPQGAPPAGGPPPDLLAALAGGGDAPPSPDDAGGEVPLKKSPKYSIDKVSPDVARYLQPGSVCGSCQFFDGKGGCHVVSGPIDPQGTCALWSGDEASGSPDDLGASPDDGSDSSGEPPSPDEGGQNA